MNKPIDIKKLNYSLEGSYVVWQNFWKERWDMLQREFPILRDNSEFDDLKSWHQEQVNKLPNYKVEPTDLAAENGDWVPILYNRLEDKFDKEGETRDSDSIYPRVLAIVKTDWDFFALTGARITMTDPVTGAFKGGWTQPMVDCVQVPTKVKIYGEEVELPLFGLLAVLEDTDGKVLVTVGQEVGSEAEKGGTVRLAVQSSYAKLKKVLAGELGVDKPLMEFLNIYCGGSVQKLIDMAMTTLPDVAEDFNRFFKENGLLVLPKLDIDSDMHKNLVADGKRKWVSRNQWKIITNGGLTNGHTIASVNIARDYHELKGV